MMKIKSFNRILIVTVLILGLSLSPVFAVTDNSELENSLKSGWTSSNYGTNGAWSYSPSGYSNSWYRQIGIMLSDLLRPVRFALTGSDSASWSNSSNTIFSRITGIYTLLSQDQTTTGSFKYYQYQQNQILSDIRSYLGTSTLNSALSHLSSITSHVGSIRDDLGYDRHQSNSLYGQLQEIVDGQEDLEQITSNTGIIANNSNSIKANSDTFIGLISGNEITSNWSWHDTTMWRDVSSSYLPLLNLNSHAYLNTYPYQSSNLSLRGLLTAIIRQQYFTATAVRSTGANQYIRGYLNNSLYNEGQPTSVMDALQYLSMALGKPLGRLQYVLADDDIIQRKQANASQTAAALDNFTGSGSAAASVSDITAVKDSVGSLKDATSGGASFSQAFNAFSGDSDGWLLSEPDRRSRDPEPVVSIASAFS